MFGEFSVLAQDSLINIQKQNSYVSKGCEELNYKVTLKVQL